MPWVSFIAAFLSCLCIIPLVRKLSIRIGKIYEPRKDRWHHSPTPTLGGIGIFVSFILGILLFRIIYGPIDISIGTVRDVPILALLGGSILIFLLGLYDDLYHVSPPVKLLGQIIAASLVIALGFTTDFFTPRINNNTIAQFLNVLVTFIWIVGITNALNLLDNMDGLAGGIGLITALILGYLFWIAGDTGLLVVALALVGGVLGFLVYNFPPAKIFMGDSGSLFLGFTLAVLAIARQPQASNVVAVLGVPTLLFLLPILDTAFVALTRVLRGDSPIKGGSDHTSHRLIAFGLSERQTVLILYGLALISGIVAISIERVGYWLSLIVVPLLILFLSLLSAYLAGIKIVKGEEDILTSRSLVSRIMTGLTYKRRIFEIILDIVLVSISLYVAYLIYFGLNITQDLAILYLRTLPVAILSSLVAFLLFSVYRGVWKYVSLVDVIRYFGAVLLSMILFWIGATLIISGSEISLVIYILFAVFLFLGLLSTRFSFRILDMASIQLRYSSPRYGWNSRKADLPIDEPNAERVMIIGAGYEGEMVLRWIQNNPEPKYLPIGFIDDSPFMVGRKIHGVEIKGGPQDLINLVEKNRVEGIIVTRGYYQKGTYKTILSDCTKKGCWVRLLRFDFELLE